jgi:predicted dienelactone hydrolase
MAAFYSLIRFCKASLLVLGCLFCSMQANSQSYQNGHISTTFTDASRSNRSVPVEIYYPADVAGDNVPFAAALVKAPAIAFGHGFVMTYDAYFNVRDAVVSQGYIIAFPTTEGSLSPAHQEFGLDLAFVLRELNTLGTTSGSPLFGKVDTFNCVMGHSMGGGAAFLAAAGDNTIKTIATLAPAETTPSAITAAGSISVPSLVFAGANDCVTTPVDHQLPMYNGLTSACKTYISITGGSHCQMAENSFTCSFGESTCTPQPAITRPQQHVIIDRYLVPWLDQQLKGLCTQGVFFDSAIAADGDITYQRNCSLCPSLEVSNTIAAVATVYPDPCDSYVQFRLPYSAHATVRVFSIAGNKLMEHTILNEGKLNVEELPSGTYFYEVSGAGGSVLRGRFVKN